MSRPSNRTPSPKICSALSRHAKPNDDWRNMASPTDRRRAQNRVAQRAYREKQKRRRREAQERGQAASTSPSSTGTYLDEPQSNQQYRNRSSSAGTLISPSPAMDTSFVPPAHTPLLSSQVFPLDQYQSAHGNQYPATSQGYSMSYPGYVQPSPSFHQSTVPPALSSPFVPFTSSMYQSQYTVGGSPGTITSGPPFTPVTPSSQGEYYPVTDGSCYGMGYAPAYDNSQAPATQAYTDSTGSVNHPVFFRQNYPPS